MKNSLISWHLARDDQRSLYRFCNKHKVASACTPVYKVDGEGFFALTFKFDNGAFIKAELRAGNEARGYTVEDHFQVVDYGWGAV